MASGPIISWQIDGGKVRTVTDFIFLGSQITAEGDCSLEIKRRLLLEGEEGGTHLVILNIRRRRTQRSTEMPKGDMILVSTRMVSRMPPHTMKQSKRLKSDTK